MTVSLSNLVHPMLSRALAEAEQKAELGTLEALPIHQNMALRPSENTNGPLSSPPTPPKSPKQVIFAPPPPSSPPTPLQEPPTPTPAYLTPDADFRILEAELANCAMTRDALSRREAVLRERKADLILETKMRLDKEVRELAMREQEGKEEEVNEENEALFMRDVQRRVGEKLKIQRVDGKARQASGGNVQGVGDVEEGKVVHVSAPERRRLARLALLERDPRLR